MSDEALQIKLESIKTKLSDAVQKLSKYQIEESKITHRLSLLSYALKLLETTQKNKKLQKDKSIFWRLLYNMSVFELPISIGDKLVDEIEQCLAGETEIPTLSEIACCVYNIHNKLPPELKQYTLEALQLDKEVTRLANRYLMTESEAAEMLDTFSANYSEWCDFEKTRFLLVKDRVLEEETESEASLTSVNFMP